MMVSIQPVFFVQIVLKLHMLASVEFFYWIDGSFC
jgi:hypothetical protein